MTFVCLLVLFTGVEMLIVITLQYRKFIEYNRQYLTKNTLNVSNANIVHNKSFDKDVQLKNV